MVTSSGTKSSYPRPPQSLNPSEAEGSRRVDDRVPVQEDEYWRCGEFREEGTNGVLHCRGEIERGALFEKGRNRADVASHVGQELAVITKTAK